MNQNELKKLLINAFEEGSSSPYDLKESIISELLESHTTRQDCSVLISSDIEKNILANILPNIPSDIKSVIKNCNMFLAGSYLLQTIIQPITGSLRKTWRADIDFYGTSESFDLLKNNKHHNQNIVPNGEYRTLSGEYDKNLKRFADMRRNYDFIIDDKFDSSAIVIEDFDITVCQICLYYEKSKIAEERSIFRLHMPLHVYKNIMDREIRLNPNRREKRKANLKRIEKYISRGFSDHTGMVENFKHNMVENPETEMRGIFNESITTKRKRRLGTLGSH